jgi:hypothetical protein
MKVGPSVAKPDRTNIVKTNGMHITFDTGPRNGVVGARKRNGNKAIARNLSPKGVAMISSRLLVMLSAEIPSVSHLKFTLIHLHAILRYVWRASSNKHQAYKTRHRTLGRDDGPGGTL